VLSSGRDSSYYFDGRRISLDPEGSYLIGECMLPLIAETDATAVGGLTLGADPIVASISLLSYIRGMPITGFIVRKQGKRHGTRQTIEGSLSPGSLVAIVDDTCTTGESILESIKEAEGIGCEVVKVITILDRCEGGSEEIKERGYNFATLLKANNQGQVIVEIDPSRE